MTNTLSRVQQESLHEFCKSELSIKNHKEELRATLKPLQAEKRRWKESMVTALENTNSTSVKVPHQNVFYKLTEKITQNKVTDEHLVKLKHEFLQQFSDNPETLEEERPIAQWVEVLTDNLHTIRCSKKKTLTRSVKRPRGFRGSDENIGNIAQRVHEIENNIKKQQTSQRPTKTSDDLRKAMHTIMKHQRMLRVQMKDKNEKKDFKVELKKKTLGQRMSKKYLQSVLEKVLCSTFESTTNTTRVSRAAMVQKIPDVIVSVRDTLNGAEKKTSEVVVFNRVAGKKIS